MSGMDRERATRHYEEAERLRARGEAALALAEVERAIEADPELPNAHNLAGWILVSSLRQTPGAMEHGIRHFEAACARFPDDPVPHVNLADALLATNHAEQALATAEAALARMPWSARPLNWLGWYHLMWTRDVDRALDYLDRAVRLEGGWGPARQNQGLALEMKGAFVAAYEAYRRALEAGDAHDVPLVYSRLAALEREWGRPRRALSLFRRSLHHERARGGGRAGEIAGAARALEEALTERKAYFPREDEEAPWIRAEIEQRREGVGVDSRENAPPLRGFRKLARATLAALRADPRGEAASSTVRRMLDVARRRALSPDLANLSFAIDTTPLSDEARARVAELAKDWPRLHRLLYTRLLERDEPSTTGGPPHPIAALIAAERHDEALAALAALRSKGDVEALLECVGVTERAGDDATLDQEPQRAAAYYAHALEAYRYYASCASSGGEGMARMLDVHRLEDKIAGPSPWR